MKSININKKMNNKLRGTQLLYLIKSTLSKLIENSEKSYSVRKSDLVGNNFIMIE